MRISKANSEQPDLVWEYIYARDLADKAAEAVKKAEAELVAYLAEHEQKSASGVYKGVRYTTSATSRETTNFDEVGIKKALGARTYNKLTISKLDRAKLQAALETGEVDAGVISQYTQITKSATGLRLTKKAADEAE